jgi:hypothetical protein
MRRLQVLLTILDGQKLLPGYLTPQTTALDTVNNLILQASNNTLMKSPYRDPATLLFAESWVASYYGQDAIFLADVDGNLNKANGPAYKFASPTQ